MARGISLVELRKELESDATKRCEQQERTIKDLIAQLKQAEKNNDALVLMCGQLFNRCHVLNPMGAMCVFCGFRAECRAWRENKYNKHSLNKED